MTSILEGFSWCEQLLVRQRNVILSGGEASARDPTSANDLMTWMGMQVVHAV